MPCCSMTGVPENQEHFSFLIFFSSRPTQSVYSQFRQFLSRNGPKVDVNPGISETLHLCTRHSGLCSYSYKSSLILHLFLKWILNIFSHGEAIKTSKNVVTGVQTAKKTKKVKSVRTHHCNELIFNRLGLSSW